MKIAVVTRFLKSPLEGVGQHTFQILDGLINKYPEIEWHLINDGQQGQIIWTANNVIHHSLSPPTRHPILWFIWYEWRLPALLKKIRPQSIWYPDGFMSLKSEIPALLTIHDLAYMMYPDGSIPSHRRFLNGKMPKQVASAHKIACVSNFIKDEIINTFRINPDKIVVTPNAPSPNFQPLSAAAIKEFRIKNTDARPYFLYLGSIHPRKNITILIKAFEQFKKSSTQPHLLVLAGRWAWKSSGIRSALEDSPYRNEILLFEDIDDLRYTLVGAASSLVYVSHYEGFGMPVIEAMACGIPVITSRDSAMQEMAGDHGIYIDPKNTDQIGMALHHLIKDTGSAARRRAHALAFSWEQSAEVILDELRALEV